MLTVKTLHNAVEVLAAQDPDLGRVVARYGPPPLWDRRPGFATLVHIILEQQVSLASALAAYDRLLEIVSPLTPSSFRILDDGVLRKIGFSRQKIRYCRILADAILTDQLDLDALAKQTDEEALDTLTALTGVGPWTANIYLLMVLCRPNVWPRGDVALAAAAQQVKQLQARPSQDDLALLANQWIPYRSVAARILWHHYLSQKETSNISGDD